MAISSSAKYGRGGRRTGNGRDLRSDSRIRTVSTEIVMFGTSMLARSANFS
ncbi:hypothetical protein [Kribbella shirazensis]|uniref:Uncharacterized protein n=1 Tax=Kribbella shirazensis TaxID=1105143 RepID=A0A7X6A3M5_9ACTN|nr:hypothetical protein [Kribbella shirazensis]NIK60065.1 hypothetical protein [Kribbella shirazensis]